MQNKELYQRNDIYYCSCCAKFYERITHKRVVIQYHEMPAEMAMEVMEDRQRIANQERIDFEPRKKHRKNKK